MWNSLIGGIELFSDKKSFSVDVDTKTNLWLLMHFKHLEIKSKTLVYQVNKGIRQRKNTVYPIRKMRKKFKNTSELLEYIDLKPYDIYNLEIEFTNGWKIKQQPSVQFHFYTSSTKERDELIHKLIGISGQGAIDILSLEENISYYYKGVDKLVKVFEDEMPSPDEFWSEERREAWKKAYIARQYKEEIEEDPEETKDTFFSTMNSTLDTDSTENDRVPWGIDSDDVPW